MCVCLYERRAGGGGGQKEGENHPQVHDLLGIQSDSGLNFRTLRT